MQNFSIKIDLSKLKNAGLVTVNGVECIAIPVAAAHLFKGKGVYLDLVAFENQMPSQYGDTHTVKQSFPKEVLEKLTPEQRKMQPIIGNMKPLGGQAQPTAQPNCATPQATPPFAPSVQYQAPSNPDAESVKGDLPF